MRWGLGHCSKASLRVQTPQDQHVHACSESAFWKPYQRRWLEWEPLILKVKWQKSSNSQINLLSTKLVKWIECNQGVKCLFAVILSLAVQFPHCYEMVFSYFCFLKSDNLLYSSGMWLVLPFPSSAPFCYVPGEQTPFKNAWTYIYICKCVCTYIHICVYAYVYILCIFVVKYT